MSIDEIGHPAMVESNHRRLTRHRLQHRQTESLIARHHIAIRVRIKVTQMVARQISRPEIDRSATFTRILTLPFGELERDVVLARVILRSQQEKEGNVFIVLKLLEKCLNEMPDVLALDMRCNCEEVEPLATGQWCAS